MPRTAIVSAMHEELAGVLALMPDERKQSVAGRDFWLGHLHGHDVVAVLSRIGKVAAATTATVLVERFATTRIVFTGVAGGIGPGVEVGDVVVARDFLQHDLDASPIFPKYEVPLYATDRFAADPALTDLLVDATRAALPQARLHQGLVLSGDRFINTTAEAQMFQLDLPGALAVEMEGAAIAQVCRDFGIPFAAVRTISDRADDQAHADFGHFIQTVASRHSVAIVERLLQSLPKQ